jgi:hypothetical protein
LGEAKTKRKREKRLKQEGDENTLRLREKKTEKRQKK